MIGTAAPTKFLPALAVALVLASASQAAASPPVITQAAVNKNTLVMLNGQLRFDSIIDVGGSGGPLTLFGQRKDTSVNTMDAYQTVDGVNALVGALQYNYDSTHQHWHYLSLDRYDLRPHVQGEMNVEVARDQKTGFCLVDNSQQNPNPTDCEKGVPGALSVSEAVQAGGSDTYTGGVDGQFIDMSGVATGDYELIQWVNSDCRLSDSGPAGHTAALVIHYDAITKKVTFPGGTPFWNAYYAGLPASQKCLPAETQRPQLNGTAQQGQILSSQPGGWLERMATSFAYQWRRCDPTGWACADIGGATSPSYAPTAADVGHTLRARVTATNAQTMEQASPQDSEATAVVQAAPSGAVLGKGPVRSFVARLTVRRAMTIRYLIKHGLRTKVHCSMRCHARLGLEVNGNVPLVHATATLRRAGTRIVTLRLNSKARRMLSHYRSGRFKLWLHVRSGDGQRQTLARTLRFR